MKTIQKTTALFLATTLSLSAALAFDFNNINPGYDGQEAQAENRSVAPKKVVIKGTVKKLNEVQQVTAPDAELKATFDMMTQEIVRVQAVYDSGQYGQALNESKKLLDTVRIRTGIHPKAKITEKIEIKDIFSEGEEDMTFSQLDEDRKEAVALAVLNHRGGLYLDILNQTKRVSLLYIKSLYKRLKQEGSLLNDDIKKIKSDLISIAAIKIDLIQYDVSARLSIKDSDVANSDQNYLFNREIKVFALNNKDLNLSEEEFDRLVNEMFVSQVPKQPKNNGFLNDPISCGQMLEQKYSYGFERLSGICKTHKMSTIQCAISLRSSSNSLNFMGALDACKESGK